MPPLPAFVTYNGAGSRVDRSKHIGSILGFLKKLFFGEERQSK